MLLQIGGRINVPIKTDKAALEGDYGHFARILVDLDLAKPILDSLTVERNGVRFFVTLYDTNTANRLTRPGIKTSPKNC